MTGVFAAGTARGPMSIPETIADAGSTAWQVLKYLGLDSVPGPIRGVRFEDETDAHPLQETLHETLHEK